MHQQCCELDVSNWSFLSVCSDPKSSCIFCCPFVLAIKLSGVRGQMRIFSAAVERLKQCLDPEEEKKRQPFVQQLQEERSEGFFSPKCMSPRSVTPPKTNYETWWWCQWNSCWVLISVNFTDTLNLGQVVSVWRFYHGAYVVIEKPGYTLHQLIRWRYIIYIYIFANVPLPVAVFQRSPPDWWEWMEQGVGEMCAIAKDGLFLHPLAQQHLTTIAGRETHAWRKRSLFKPGRTNCSDVEEGCHQLLELQIEKPWTKETWRNQASLPCWSWRFL